MASSLYTTAALQNLLEFALIRCSSHGRPGQQKRFAPSTQGSQRQGQGSLSAVVCTTQETVSGTRDKQGATAT